MDSEDTGQSTDLKKMARRAELKATESILRWKHRKEGTQPPPPEALERQSRVVTEQVHEILARRGKRLWKEIKSLVEK